MYVIYFFYVISLGKYSSFSEIYCRWVKICKHFWRTLDWKLHTKPIPPALGKRAWPGIWTYSRWAKVGQEYGTFLPNHPADLPTTIFTKQNHELFHSTSFILELHPNFSAMMQNCILFTTNPHLTTSVLQLLPMKAMPWLLSGSSSKRHPHGINM